MTVSLEQRFYYSIGQLSAMEGHHAMREADLFTAQTADLAELVANEAAARERLQALTNPTRPDRPKRGVSKAEWMATFNTWSDFHNMLLVRCYEEGAYLRDEADVLRETLLERVAS